MYCSLSIHLKLYFRHLVFCLMFLFYNFLGCQGNNAWCDPKYCSDMEKYKLHSRFRLVKHPVSLNSEYYSSFCSFFKTCMSAYLNCACCFQNWLSTIFYVLMCQVLCLYWRGIQCRWIPLVDGESPVQAYHRVLWWHRDWWWFCYWFITAGSIVGCF